VTRPLHLWDEADLDVFDAVAWYEDQRTGLGAELLIELDAVLQRIMQTPLQFPEIKGNVRRALLHRFPYSVYFSVGDETVEVIAVLHQHRDPRTWEQRILE
jgi:plasmid stabilization system protein ParE